MFNDNDGESNTSGATRYPCMPSLVALQQMRNRLHLAYLGKKLMKWTALATGRELRKLAGELAANYETFGEDIRNAFILLARARYFYPNLNKTVLENVTQQASITVSPSVKTVSGVKLLHLDILDSDIDPYEHLGIDKGGQSIFEAKKAWRDLIKKMILITEQRIGFIQVDQANRTATKRQNVLIKIVIPRINATIRYILIELEEMAREELYRIKMIKRNKRKTAEKKNKPEADHIYPICDQNLDLSVAKIEDIEEIPTSTIKPSEQSEVKSKPEITNKLPTLIKSKTKIMNESLQQYSTDRKGEKESGEAVKSIIHTQDTQKLDNLKEQPTKLKLDTEKEDMPSSSIEQFLPSKEYKEEPPSEGGLDKLVSQINETIKLSKDAKQEGLISESVEDFVKSCEDVKKQIISSREAKDQLQQPKVLDDLRFNIDDLIKLITKYKAEGLITESVEKFVKSCETVKSKIDVYERFPPDDSEGQILYPTCSQSCTCADEEDSLHEVCERCQEMLNEKSSIEEDDSLPPPQCNFCQGITEQEDSEDIICKTYNSNEMEPSETKDWPAYVSPEMSESHLCEICKKHMEGGINDYKKNAGRADIVATDSPSADASLGYFEKKVRKITKVKRTQNPDGTIREEKETILIRKEKHDPNETALVEDGDEGEVSYESLLDDDVKEVALYIDPEQSQRGFVSTARNPELEDSNSITSMAGQILRQCISFLKNNVVTKIVIPRIIATIRYIQSELEEKEREETFRLKRFKQFKSKNKKAGEKEVLATCDVCRKSAKLKGLSSESKLRPRKSSSSKEIENKKHLDHLISHINELIDLTKKYEVKGIVPPSIEDFIKTCDEVKEKIKNATHICDICKKSLEEDTVSNIVLPTQAVSTQSIELPSCTHSMLVEASQAPAKPKVPLTPQEPLTSDSTYNLSSVKDDKFGYFEKKFKEIVKVTRLQNQDGSISEEKQVITIRTERKNPQKSNALDGQSNRMNDDDKSPDVVGSCADGRRGHGGEKGGTDSRNFDTRETKSEHANRSHPMGEPKLRSCMSANLSKSNMNKEVATNFDLTRDLRNTVVSKVSKSSSIDSNVCCPKKCAAVGGSEPLSVVSSETFTGSCRTEVTSSSTQAYVAEVPIKIAMEDKGTSCSQISDSDALVRDNLKVQTVYTDAIWRDVCTSTTDLYDLPSKSVKLTSSYISKDLTESTENKREKTKSCCTIKIIQKPPLVGTFEKETDKNENFEVVLKGSMLDAIKRIFIPPPVKSDEVQQVKDTTKPEIKSICKSCLSKMKSVESLQKSSIGSSLKSSTCKMCQAEADEEVEEEIPSYVSSKYESSLKSSTCKMCQAEAEEETGKEIPSNTSSKHTTCDPTSYMSAAVGSDTICTKSKYIQPKSTYNHHTCGLSKTGSYMQYKDDQMSDDYDVGACCAKGSNTPSKTVCCLKSSKNPCCPLKDSNTSLKTEPVETKDASTSTNRSARFDVRPLPMMSRKFREKINMGDCVCRSDTKMVRGTSRKPAKTSKSFYEDDYYYFRW